MTGIPGIDGRRWRPIGHHRHGCTAVRGSARGSPIMHWPMWTSRDHRPGRRSRRCLQHRGELHLGEPCPGCPACCSSAEPFADLGPLHRQQATAARGSTSSAATVRAADPPRPSRWPRLAQSAARRPRCSGAARASPARAPPARSPRPPARAARRIRPCGASTIPATTPCTAPNPSDQTEDRRRPTVGSTSLPGGASWSTRPR
jgi:hypothetical protein